jgi:hypothetical protein
MSLFQCYFGNWHLRCGSSAMEHVRNVIITKTSLMLNTAYNHDTLKSQEIQYVS